MAQITDQLEIPPVRGWRWRTVRPCGTLAAWRRHQRRGEPSDPKCRKAHADDMRRRYARRKAGAPASPKSASTALAMKTGTGAFPDIIRDQKALF